MKKLLLLFAVLLTTVGAWAQGDASSNVPVDGVYTIENVFNKRGTLAYGVKNDNSYFGLSDITLKSGDSDYSGNSITVNDVKDKYWYITTMGNVTYICNLGQKKFLQTNSGDVATISETPNSGTFAFEAKDGGYTCVKSGDKYLCFSCGYPASQGQVRWLTYEAAASNLTFGEVENGLNTYKADIDAIKRKIYQSKGYLFGNYVIKSGNAKYMASNTHMATVGYGVFAFYPDLTSPKAHKIFSISEGKWVSYDKKDSYGSGDSGTSKVKLVDGEENANSWYIDGVQGHNGSYQVSPYTNNGDVGSIYWNWHGGNAGVALGYYTTGGASDAGSRWNFIEPNLPVPVAGKEYVLYDEIHKLFLDIKNLGTEPNDRAKYKELATLNSEKQTLYITTATNESWKIHTTPEGGNYLGQYFSGKPWSSRVNADQGDYNWTVEYALVNNEWYYVLRNLSGTSNGYLGTDPHNNGKELYVDQQNMNRALKLKVWDASCVYKVNATPGIGTVIYDGKRYADGDYILADSEIAEGDLSLVNVIGYSNTIALDNNEKVITATYTENFNPDGLQVLLKNKQHNKFLGVNFAGGELDNAPVPTTHKFSGNAEADYRNCWELQLTTYEQNYSALPCFVLYNSYYDWYAGKIVGRNSTIDVVKSINDAGRFDIDCVEQVVNGETVKVLTFRCLNKTTTNDYWYLHMVDWGNYGVVDWDYNADASKWYMTEVTDEMIADWNDQVKLDMALFKEYCDAMVRPGIGYYGGLTDEQINIIKNIEVGDEDIDINKARECLYAMYYQHLIVLNKPTPGFYYIKSMNANDAEKKNKYWQVNANGTQMELAVNKDEKRSIIYVADDYKLVSYGCGFYLNHYNRVDRIISATDTLTMAKAEGQAWGIVENAKVKTTYALDHPTEDFFLSDWTGAATYGRNDENAAWTFEAVDKLPVTITSAGYATFYCPVAVTLPDDLNLKAYAVSETTDAKAMMNEIDGVIPSKTGVILKGAPKTYYLTIGGEATAVANILDGSVASEYVGTQSYVLSNQEGGVGFYKATMNFSVDEETGKITKPEEGVTGTHFLNNGFKAYLPKPEGSNSRFFVFDFGGTETGIVEIENGNVNAENSVVYDLAGRRVQKAQKGLYIVNGKKVVK